MLLYPNTVDIIYGRHERCQVQYAVTKKTGLAHALGLRAISYHKCGKLESAIRLMRRKWKIERVCREDRIGDRRRNVSAPLHMRLHTSLIPSLPLHPIRL
jgi:hypothetical protein